MNILQNQALLEKLAAEYVLGTLRGGARRRFESYLPDSATLRLTVAEWRDRLYPIIELAPVAKPSARVWLAIEKRLGLQILSARKRKASFWLSLREDLSFWRGLGLVSTTAALILVSLLMTKQLAPIPVAPVTSYVAMLSDDKATPIAVVTAGQNGQMVVKVIAPQSVAADKSLELWAVPKEGPPRSLGLVAANGSVTLPLPANATPQSIPLLAVTLEPKGGSPNPNGPTGPVVFKGAWVQI
ncbi:anti-sigma factor domain-containing protein [Glaciimonas sp. PAMC28666]|uniref:anti-sigma factor n=1 Tax=Glaciimonas sp. PAMC28666 TaxID=2807626 RepID=UPI0019636898|nr:anti-sigma factor [Glaciimonas sp. PAMC28666]QRX80809.1 anti-sigma factor [Glaciimonas sp. PAMC28666]